MNTPAKKELMQKLNAETSKMYWSELERFFANGTAVFIEPSLDLIEAAAEMSLDNKTVIAAWMAEKKLGLVEEQQAAQWAAENALLWASVVAPWVLVQPIKNSIQ